MDSGGSSSMGSFFKRFDVFFKMDEELMVDPTVHGTILSGAALGFMVMLFIVELTAFLQTGYSSQVSRQPRWFLAHHDQSPPADPTSRLRRRSSWIRT